MPEPRACGAWTVSGMPLASLSHELACRVKTTGMNQQGVAVIEFTRTFMIWKRGHVPS